MIDYVQFFPTLKCNKKCRFCFSREINFDDFPKERIDHFIDFLVENKINNLDILGGEPFLYKPINELVEKASEKNIAITVSTNGTSIDSLNAFLKHFDNKKVKVGVSINDSPNPALLEVIKHNKLWIKSVITKEKIPEIGILEFAKNIGITYYLIYMDALTEEDLSKSIPFYEFIDKIGTIKSLFPNVEPVFCKGFIGGNLNYRCPAGSEKITIMPDGSIYPCYLLSSSLNYRLGNIFKSSLKGILSSEKLQIFKTYQGNICNNKICSLHNICKGGCVAHSIIHYGMHKKADPRCNKMKEE